VFYREGKAWIAHCLDFNVVGDGETKAEAVSSMSHFVRIQVEASAEINSESNLFTPAKKQYFEMESNKIDLNFEVKLLEWSPKLTKMAH